MITELVNSNSYNVFVPSIQKEINFTLNNLKGIYYKIIAESNHLA